MAFTPSDVTNLLRLVQGQPVPGAVTGIRALSGRGNNILNTTWGMANTSFRRVTAASTRLVYDRTSGTLWHDANGNLAGGFTPIATLRNGGTPLPTLTTADLTLIA